MPQSCASPQSCTSSLTRPNLRVNLSAGQPQTDLRGTAARWPRARSRRPGPAPAPPPHPHRPSVHHLKRRKREGRRKQATSSNVPNGLWHVAGDRQPAGRPEGSLQAMSSALCAQREAHMSGCSGSAAPACPLQAAAKEVGRRWAWAGHVCEGTRRHHIENSEGQEDRWWAPRRRHNFPERIATATKPGAPPACMRHGQVRPVGQALLYCENDFVVCARKKCAPGGADGVIPDAAIRVDHRAACDVRRCDLRRRGGPGWGRVERGWVHAGAVGIEICSTLPPAHRCPVLPQPMWRPYLDYVIALFISKEVMEELHSRLPAAAAARAGEGWTI